MWVVILPTVHLAKGKCPSLMIVLLVTGIGGALGHLPT
jgi:hypothetical protein